MEIRDFVALAALGWGVLAFTLNWMHARGWEHHIKMRDELARFAGDQDVAGALPREVQESARQASVYLSLELAEDARLLAARRAKRADSGFWWRLALRGLASVGAVAIFVGATVIGWGQRTLFENAVGAAYFGVVSLGVAIAYWSWVKERWGVRKQTGELARFRKEVAEAKPLLSHDARKFRTRAHSAAKGARDELIAPGRV